MWKCILKKGAKTVWNELEADKAFKKSLDDPIWKNIQYLSLILIVFLYLNNFFFLIKYQYKFKIILLYL